MDTFRLTEAAEELGEQCVADLFGVGVAERDGQDVACERVDDGQDFGVPALGGG